MCVRLDQEEECVCVCFMRGRLCSLLYPLHREQGMHKESPWKRFTQKKKKDLPTGEWMATAFTRHSGGDISRVSAPMSLSEKREMGPSHPQRWCSHLHTHAQVWRKRRGLKLGEQRDLGRARRQVGGVLGSGC